MLVTVICQCYNQAPYVERALASVISQTHASIQLIIVDDGSSDNSVAVIDRWLANYHLNGKTGSQIVGQTTNSLDITWLHDGVNLGQCKRFNIALAYAKGSYVIDLAADDYLHQDCISKQMYFLESLDAVAKNPLPVLHSNGWKVNAKGQKRCQLIETSKLVPLNGREALVQILAGEQFYNCTFLMPTAVLRQLGGFNEALSYEDFDFRVRASQIADFWFNPAPLVFKTEGLPTQSSQGFIAKSHRHLQSTLTVFRYAATLPLNHAELKALAACIRYYLRVAAYTGSASLTKDLFWLHSSLSLRQPRNLWFWLAISHFNLGWLYKAFQKVR